MFKFLTNLFKKEQPKAPEPLIMNVQENVIVQEQKPIPILDEPLVVLGPEEKPNPTPKNKKSTRVKRQKSSL